MGGRKGVWFANLWGWDWTVQLCVTHHGRLMVELEAYVAVRGQKGVSVPHG